MHTAVEIYKGLLIIVVLFWMASVSQQLSGKLQNLQNRAARLSLNRAMTLVTDTFLTCSPMTGYRLQGPNKRLI